MKAAEFRERLRSEPEERLRQMLERARAEGPRAAVEWIEAELARRAPPAPESRPAIPDPASGPDGAAADEAGAKAEVGADSSAKLEEAAPGAEIEIGSEGPSAGDGEAEKESGEGEAAAGPAPATEMSAEPTAPESGSGPQAEPADPGTDPDRGEADRPSESEAPAFLEPVEEMEPAAGKPDAPPAGSDAGEADRPGDGADAGDGSAAGPKATSPLEARFPASEKVVEEMVDAPKAAPFDARGKDFAGLAEVGGSGPSPLWKGVLLLLTLGGLLTFLFRRRGKQRSGLEL